MSTKTLRKRIALVAVSALGFGLVSTVPANAALGASVITAITDKQGIVGQTLSVPVVITSVSGAAAAAGDTIVLTPTADSSLAGIAPANPGTTTTAPANWTVNATGTGALTATSVTTSAAASIDTKTVGSLQFIPVAAGTYTITVTGSGTATFAATVSFKIHVSPAQGSALAAQTLADGTNGTIYQTAADTPTIMVTRALGQATSAGDIALRVVSAPNVTKFPVGSVIRTGSLTPGTGETFTSIASTFGTSFTATTLVEEGLYEFTAFVDANASNLLDSGEASAAVSFRIVGIADSAVASLDSTSTQSASKVFNMTITVTDANGYPTYTTGGVPTITETVTLTSTAAAVTTAEVIDDSAAAGAVRIGTGNTYRSAITYTTTADSLLHSFKYTPVCPTVACTTNTGATFSVLTSATAAVATELALASATGIYTGTVGASSYSTTIPADATVDATLNTGMVAVTADPAVTTFSFTLTGTAAKVYTVTTTPGVNTAASRITAPTSVTTLADGKVTFVVTVTTPVAATALSAIRDSFTVNVAGTTANNFGYTITYAAPTALWTLSPAATSNARVLQATSNVVTAKLTDVYGRVLANKAYTVSVAGRNVSASAGVTDANGLATYTVNDTDTRAYTTALGTTTDTVTFSHTDPSGDYAAVTGAVTFTYVTALTAVGSVVVTVVTTAETIDQIEAAPGVPLASKTYTATVRTATGAAAGAGILVTFAGGADDIFLDGIKTGVTNASGQAAVAVYRQKVGYSVITATANGVSGSALPVLWSNNVGTVPADGTGGTLSTSARNVAVSAAQSVVGGSAATVIATVTDRWGNPVAGHLVTWSYSGVGRPVSGADATVGTDTNGQAQFQVTALSSETGVMNVKATISGGQTANLAGFVVATPVTGVTAGNTTATAQVTFTKDTSVSTADALLELAKAIGTGKSVEEAADAAAEAIDAANAATDAANLAAEAADAATVAAEEARDAADSATAAVEELATQVATLMAALKAQLTTLANTVAKIAKKVKA